VGNRLFLIEGLIVNQTFKMRKARNTSNKAGLEIKNIGIHKKKTSLFFWFVTICCVLALIYWSYHINWRMPINFDYTGNGTYANSQLSVESVPTVINGMIASTSVIIGFSGAIVGIKYREISEKNELAAGLIFVFLAVFIFSIWNEFSAFENFASGGPNFLEIGYKSALTGLVSSLFTLFFALLIIAQIMEKIENRQQTTV
jgi:hypothetical protein